MLVTKEKLALLTKDILKDLFGKIAATTKVKSMMSSLSETWSFQQTAQESFLVGLLTNLHPSHDRSSSIQYTNIICLDCNPTLLLNGWFSLQAIITPHLSLKSIRGFPIISLLSYLCAYWIICQPNSATILANSFSLLCPIRPIINN